MSVQGTQKDNIRTTVQPLLDAIAPNCRINKLELNSAAKGWQDSFFENKIRQPLQLDVLVLNGVWDDDVTPIKQVSDILFFLEHQHDNSTSSLIDSVKQLQKYALDYLREIHVDAAVHLQDTNNFKYSEHKAQIAFYRMINIQLSFEAIKLLDQMSNEEAQAFTEATHQEKDDRIEGLKGYIQELTSFSTHQELSLRYAKIKNTDANSFFAWFSHKNHNVYFGGHALDKSKSTLRQTWNGLNLWNAPRAFWLMSTHLCKSAVLSCVVKAQQTCATWFTDLTQAMVAEDLNHFQQAVEVTAIEADILNNMPIVLPEGIIDYFNGHALKQLYEDIAIQRLTLCTNGSAGTELALDYIKISNNGLCGQPTYLPAANSSIKVTNLAKLMSQSHTEKEGPVKSNTAQKSLNSKS